MPVATPLPPPVRGRYLRRPSALLVWPLIVTMPLPVALAAAPPASAVSGRLLTPSPRATYYVSQRVKKGTVRLKVNWPEDDLASLMVRGRIPYGASFVRIDRWRKRVQRDNDVTFGLEELPYGAFTVRVIVVQRETGKLAGQAYVPFRKLPYRPNEVCLSAQGWVLAKQRKALPLAACLSSVPKRFDALASSGFDALILPTGQLPPTQTGLRLIASMPTKGDVAALSEPIGKANAAAEFFGWHTTRGMQSDVFRRFVDLCPYHPLIVTLPASQAGKSAWADIVCVTPDRAGKGKAPDYGSWAAAIEKLAGKGRAVWASIPTGAAPAVLRMAAYLSLASGAKGIVCHLDPLLDKAKGWPSLRAAIAEVAQHREVFLHASSLHALTPKPPAKLRAVAIEHQSRTYVFVANPGAQTLKCEVPIPGLEPGRQLWVVGEKRTVQLDGNAVLRDSFKPLEAHVYTTRPGA